MTKRTPACLESCRGLLRVGAFPQRQALSKLRVPLVSDADVVTDDFAAERCGRYCRVQRLVTVKGDGQVGTDGTFGYLAGVGADAAGQ